MHIRPKWPCFQILAWSYQRPSRSLHLPPCWLGDEWARRPSQQFVHYRETVVTVAEGFRYHFFHHHVPTQGHSLSYLVDSSRFPAFELQRVSAIADLAPL